MTRAVSSALSPPNTDISDRRDAQLPPRNGGTDRECTKAQGRRGFDSLPSLLGIAPAETQTTGATFGSQGRAEWDSLPQRKTPQCLHIAGGVHRRKVTDDMSIPQTDAKEPKPGTPRWYQGKIKELEDKQAKAVDSLAIAGLSARNAAEERDRARQAAQWAEGLLAKCLETLNETPWKCDAIADVPTRVSGLRYGYKLALSDIGHQENLRKEAETKLAETEALRAETLKSLEAATADLATKTYELATLKDQQEGRLPAPIFWLAGVILLVVVVLIAHQAGFQAGQNYRLGVAP